MEMMMAWSLVIIAFSMLMIMAAAVAALWRIRKLAMEAEKLVETVRMNMPPLIHDITKISSDIRSIVHTLERQAPKVGDMVEALRVTARDVHDFERMIRERLERPLLDLTALVSGIARGLVTFWRTLFSR
ncbi:MAG: hypothetical protein ONB46_15150 [candidate division KSB1 bacterium]|nr:hypothetical protein [candidate division KSB1 bacterium]MDZ7366974.1 hypothetical protein [candidate division KSB1 bacterium]MDZ7406821.1 hypothetical protein [candidate division KSB1 bacterium]